MNAEPIEFTTVKPEWIDLYGHMNMAYYVQILDELGHRILDRFGLGEGYTVANNCGLFTVQAEIKYLREVRADAPLRVMLKPIKFDEKRLVTEVSLYHHNENYLSASMLQTAVHVDLATRKACDFPQDALLRLEHLLDQYAQNGWASR